jgi:hypothetical protein
MTAPLLTNRQLDGAPATTAMAVFKPGRARRPASVSPDPAMARAGTNDPCGARMPILDHTIVAVAAAIALTALVALNLRPGPDTGAGSPARADYRCLQATLNHLSHPDPK